MPSQTLTAKLNAQIQIEFMAFYTYLGMAAWCERQDLPGIASWLEMQAQEEHEHGMKIYRWMNDWDLDVRFEPLSAPPLEYGSLVEVFEGTLAGEQRVSSHIHELCKMAEDEHAMAIRTAFDWFIQEQVLEEKTARENLAFAKRVASDAAGLFHLDQQMGGRAQGTGGPEEASA